MHGPMNVKSVSRVYSVAPVLCLQKCGRCIAIAHDQAFALFSLTLFEICAQCMVKPFCVVPRCRAFQVC